MNSRYVVQAAGAADPATGLSLFYGGQIRRGEGTPRGWTSESRIERSVELSAERLPGKRISAFVDRFMLPHSIYEPKFSVIRRTTGGGTSTREVKPPEIVVLHSTHHGDDVNPRAHHVDDLQGSFCHRFPPFESSKMYSLIQASARGGKVLSLLHEHMNDISGEAKSKELCLFLIRAASVPYMQTLEKWVYKGVISDPYQEFLVEDNELIQREELPMDYSADYWEKRYTVRHERIPVFLIEHAQTILRTGKYLNVIRQCGKFDDCMVDLQIVLTNFIISGKTVQWGKQEPLEYQHRGQKYIAAIDRAYSEAARTLLEVLIQENDLMGRLRSVKNYFLLSQGDFVVRLQSNFSSSLAM